VPTLSRPMGRTKALNGFVEPARVMVDAAFACITHISGTDSQSECTWPVIAQTLTGNPGMNTASIFFRTFLIFFIALQMPIVIIGLAGLILYHTDMNVDEELKKRCEEKQTEIRVWCEAREMRLRGSSLYSMIRYDLGFASELDDPERMRAILKEYELEQYNKKFDCPNCEGTGKAGCNSRCNECNGTGKIGNKLCQIEKTSNDQGKVPCPDNRIQTCEYCGFKFCAYHHFVNKSQEFGSFGGHVCTKADDTVPSRSKNICHALGAFFGHAIGLW